MKNITFAAIVILCAGLAAPGFAQTTSTLTASDATDNSINPIVAAARLSLDVPLPPPLPEAPPDGNLSAAGEESAQPKPPDRSIASISHLFSDKTSNIQEKELELPPVLRLPQQTPPIVIAANAEAAPTSGTAGTVSPAGDTPPSAPSIIEDGKRWINMANVHDLMDVLEIDYWRARNIVEYREIFGDYQQPSDLSAVFGIHKEKIDELITKVKFAPYLPLSQ